MTVASSYLSEPRVSLATAAIVIQTTSLMDTLPTMLSTSVSARVGNELGADGRRSGHGPHRWLVHQLIVEQGVHRRRGGPPAHEGRAAGDRAIRARKRPADDGARCARQPVRLLPGGSAGGAGAGLLVRFGLSGLSLGLLTGQVARALSMVYMDWEGEAMMCNVMSTFLEDCYLCRRRLQHGKDIYMYRGDRAFCSEECRRRQIFMDEESGKRDNCPLAAAASGKYPVGRRSGRATVRRRVLAGGFAH
ncbi:hypothetical protein OPV22_029722 [Ensete ventricosum]|uniref:FLZ-type domain-containing protein n=1 Tax=Ensete ventricosum TaxID=4639 RepID=A0AAV8Q6M0_ENSVE|nr:hypothetical protein OPV22_029722 [Ensete ventricosum]